MVQNDRKGVLSKRGFGGSDFDIEILYFSYIILFSLRFSKVFPSKPLEGKTFENLRKNKIMYEKYKISMSKSDPTKPRFESTPLRSFCTKNHQNPFINKVAPHISILKLGITSLTRASRGRWEHPQSSAGSGGKTSGFGTHLR